MKIGIWLGTYSNPQSGGGFSYVDKLISAIDSYQFSPMIEICFISEGECSRHLESEVVKLQFHSRYLLYSFFLNLMIIKFVKIRVKRLIQNKIERKRRSQYTEQLKERDIKLIYYLQQAQCALPDFPFIATNWDIGHCSTYAFPELISSEIYESRYVFYNNCLPRALFVFAESEAGKEELIKYTKINASKIKVVPIFSGDCVKQIMPEEHQDTYLKKNGLIKNKYFLYPAQFWAHKNHVGLLKAFSVFLKDYPDFKLVLTGSDKGTLAHVLNTACLLKIQDEVSYLGFVSTEEMNALYQNATSLVMASFFGPTNMPPLEAMELGCPVVCSDLAGHREELEDAAIYFNPMDPDEIVKAMKKVFLERDSYLKRIKDQAGKTTFTIENALKAIDKNLCEVILIRDNWA